jgi:hypothetical protein
MTASTQKQNRDEDDQEHGDADEAIAAMRRACGSSA